ncbi:MAG: manganese efflux pump MntP [Eubacteriales bacterium]
MSLFVLGALAVALGTDAFSLCVGIGLAGVTRRQVFLLTVTVFLYHVFMPLAGWMVGEFAGNAIGRTAAFAGALLLVCLGIRMVWMAVKVNNESDLKIVRFNTWGLLILGASVSMDALSVGFTLGAVKSNLLFTAAVIGVVAGAMTFAGLVFGRFIGNLAGTRAQVLGGLILVGIGVRLAF